MGGQGLPTLLAVGGLVALGAAYLALRGENLAHLKESALNLLHRESRPGPTPEPEAAASQSAPEVCPSDSDQTRRIVVIGGGLAGCTAALSAQATISHAGTDTVQVVLVEGMPKLGGNSAKASSGINALNPEGGDTQELFESDTLQSGGGRSKPELISTLVSQSQDAIAFLQSFSVDLSKVTLLGGHSKPRSRTNPIGGNVGWSIMSKVTAAVKQTPGIKVMESHKLERLVRDAKSGSICGVVLSSEGRSHSLPAQAVILATGGFAANRNLLAQHSPEAAKLATTNGPWAQGDALAVAEAVGARLKDLDQVQIHPTGFVDPADVTAGTKFLAPEKLRGVGGILLNALGKRFINELGLRDAVSAAVSRQSGHEAYLVLSEEAAQDYGLSAIQFYVSKGLMAKVQGVSELAQLIGDAALETTLAAELQAYNAAREGVQPDAWGKTVFPTGFVFDGVMYAGRITPVVHYTMGGVEIDAQARVLDSRGQPIPGLFAAGEVSAGVHGRNRLGGNSLLECTVFGRIAGDKAALTVLN